MRTIQKTKTPSPAPMKRKECIAKLSKPASWQNGFRIRISDLLIHFNRSSPQLLLDFLNGSLNSHQRGFPPQHFQRLEQWRRVLTTADSYPNGLEHLSGFEPEFLRSGAEVLVQGVVFEFSLRQDFPSAA